MKKLKYIIAFILIGMISFQPFNNYFTDINRQKYEDSINDLNSLHALYQESRKLPKEQRPDLRGLREHIMTVDLSLDRVPKERLIEAIDQIKSRKNSYALSSRMTEVNWQERGPNTIGGRTRAVMFDPNNATKIWAAGVNGGLWYNEDITSNTQNWNLVDGTWASLAVSSIAYDSNDSNTMYVGTGERFGNWTQDGSNWYSPGASKGIGMFKTTDGGATWSILTSTSDFAFITDILIRDENGQSAIYITVAGNEYEGTYIGRESTGIWKSNDQGSSWTRITESIVETTGNSEFNNLQVGLNGRLWAGTRMNSYWSGGGEIYYSDDNGSSWTSSSWSSGLTGDANRVDIRVAPSDPNTVYALVGEISTPRWLAKTSDNGVTWTQLDLPQNQDANSQNYGGYLSDVNGTANWAIGFGVDASDANKIYAGVIDLYKSSDGGSSWTHMSDWRNVSSGLQYLHADHHAVRSINTDEIVFANDGGIFYTSNGGVNIYQRNEGYNVGQFYSVALHPDAGSEYVLGGTQDNGSWKIEGNGIGQGLEVTGGDGGFAHIDQLNPNYQFTAANGNNIYRSTNGGATWSSYSSYSSGTLINPSGIDPNTQTIYTNATSTSIVRLDNYTALASRYTMNINLGSQATFFKISPHTNDVLFVGTAAGRIFKITDASTSSFTVNELTGSNVSGYISSIDIGSSDNQILITVSNYGATSVFETYAGGGSNGWVNVEGDLPDMPVRAGLYNRNNFNQVIIGTDLGTWTSDDISSSSPIWLPSNDGLNNVRVDMLVNRDSDNAIVAATHGRGIFYSPNGFTSTAPLNAAFTPNKTSGVFPLTITFNDRSTGSPSSWSWDFGDGTTSTDQSPSHTYTAAGKYNVSLIVSDGTNSNSTTKNEIVWATAEQDILWEEGFETNPYFWADGRRDVHAFGAINSNGDADEFSWWYYTAGYGAADGSHWMAGLGMAGAGTADDWLISPTLWLRPGTDNILSFYSNMNGGSEDYDLLLSPSGGNAISDFTVVLADIDGESTANWVQQTYDLTAYAGTNVRIAMHVKTASQQYSFWDNFQLTAGQLDVAGPPLAPQGVSAEAELVYDSANDSWDPSDDGVAIFWNRNGETDLASYNVYGSLTDNFTPGSGNLLGQGTLGNIDSEHFEPSSSTSPWPDTTFIFRQTFGVDSLLHDGLTQGQQWYYKVGAVDNDGNETISDQVSYILDSEGPTAGTFTINSIVDGSYLRSTSEVTVTAADWSDNSGINYYALGIGSSGDNTTADVVPYQNVGTSTLELTGLSLDDYTTYYVKLYAVDDSGNNSSLVINDFMTYTNLLGDYDADWDVDVEDLNAFVNAWPNAGVNTTVDIGPATGTSPYLSPSFDSLNDINDVSVFTRNWLWTKAQGKTSEPSEQKLDPIDLPAELFGNQIKITLPDNITAGRFEILNEGNTYQFSVAKNNQSMIILENNDSLEESYEFEFGRLSQDEKELFIYIDGDASMKTVEVSYQLFSKDGAAGNGIMELGSPDEFKLYQNYPNPFSSQTTFQYDVAEATSVKIYIYNTLGQLVKTIDRGDNGVGTHTVEWDGKNDDGDTLSSGVYFYQLRTKDFNKTMKMLLVK
ncbi:PKD domain-containing protein [Candidatus Marinimicrobia bacterium]|nr:PKD domain-containing protein [Candidatus Neomarinimicrobiota bacterium]